MMGHDMQRIAMVVEFDGRAFHGWQQQDNAVTVQATLQQALEKIEGKPVTTYAAGRTDTGVHAEALLVHCDVSAKRWHRSHLAYLHGCNHLLPETVRVVGVKAVADDFHARFDCQGRAYRYQIWNRNSASALQQWRHWWMPRSLDLELMQQAGLLCMGTQDFSALRAAGCQAAHAIRTISRLDIEQDGHCIFIHVAADAFIYHMVRNLVGNLVAAGLGKMSPDDFKRLLEEGDRSKGAATAPAHGLYFVNARYEGFTSRDLIGSC
ncbi:tRNA pseudouridine38-40 synthase [Mariprofundus micogutta]|uniref:tRNA pseudouridine synthase A n=1 Tax=Mariprofundus micogutta TaxID=1921010 RepID=A0A1L8CP55_9PROT|nr:tRNA pseudouridine(38-40) synthase TruA [Mariprofundus micogutta]GAV20702.1 tRNA pseudouridine38-40 synthase [Mariprofundus micogutta]